jgi:hypothetical protein
MPAERGVLVVEHANVTAIGTGEGVGLRFMLVKPAAGAGMDAGGRTNREALPASPCRARLSRAPCSVGSAFATRSTAGAGGAAVYAS